MKSNKREKAASAGRKAAWADRIANLFRIKEGLSDDQRTAIQRHVQRLQHDWQGLPHFLRTISPELADAWTEWDAVAWNELVSPKPPDQYKFWHFTYLCQLDLAARILLYDGLVSGEIFAIQELP